MSLSVQVKYPGHDPETDRKAVSAVGRDPDHSGFYFPEQCRDLVWDTKDLHEAETLKGKLTAAGMSATILLHGSELQ
jgi:hypothetical protein